MVQKRVRINLQFFFHNCLQNAMKCKIVYWIRLIILYTFESSFLWLLVCSLNSILVVLIIIVGTDRATKKFQEKLSQLSRSKIIIQTKFIFGTKMSAGLSAYNCIYPGKGLSWNRSFVSKIPFNMYCSSCAKSRIVISPEKGEARNIKILLFLEIRF